MTANGNPQGGHTMLGDKGTKAQKYVSSYIRVYKILWIKFHFRKWRKDVKTKQVRARDFCFLFYIFGHFTRFLKTFYFWLICRLTRSVWNSTDKSQVPFIQLPFRVASYMTITLSPNRETDIGKLSHKILYSFSEDLRVPEGSPHTVWPRTHQVLGPCLSL